MTESSPVYTRDTLKRRGVISVADFTSMVRIPGKPATFVAYTAEEDVIAHQHAETEGCEYIPLPVADPAWDWEAHQPSIPAG
ncbi:hypothetical protein [Mycobacteroides abscessus]|uniref:hypothetical protein n=1 Tax=Mycobacteroides abscessus TaxID=36809 RepID=UPI0009A834D3|nr:hypothetical protein [Mycobacteroides abscessus]